MEPITPKSSIFRRFLRYFLRGLLYTVPLAITLYIMYAILKFIDGFIFSGPQDVKVALADGTQLLIEDAKIVGKQGGIKYIPGLGLLILIAGVTAIGYFGSTIFAQPIRNQLHRLLDKAPLLKTIYTSLQDLVSAFVGKKKGFDRPVLVKLSKDTEIEKPGFITQKDLTELGISEGKVAVYLPHSYNFSGNLFIVPKENVTPIDVKSGDLMKFIVSGGVAEIEKE